jgi:hypothetical protein
MSNQNEIRIVLGSKKFAGNTDKDIWIQPKLFSEKRDMVENDRSIMINQLELFNKERQKSGIYRVSGKITNIFNNEITGKTSYSPFKNYLYYTNAVQNALNNASAWEGTPQFDEFTFLRSEGIPNHTPFAPKSASSYNWGIYVTYPFSSNTTQNISYRNENITTSVYNTANVGDGIPFCIKTSTNLGNPIVYFYCATPHNLVENQWVELSFTINGKNIFQVYSLGDGTYGSEKNVFALFDMKFPVSDIPTGKYGSFKRIITTTNSGESKSRYYVRLHKVLTVEKDCNLAKAGFENNPFPIKQKLEYSATTPNQQQRVSKRQGTQSFSYSFDRDININGLMDNNGKPITELYVSIINKGYMGWFNQPLAQTQKALDIGWEFNFLKNSVDIWWNHTSFNNKDEIFVDSYIQNGQTFYYNKELSIGDVIKGDFCEYNDIEQKEYVLSKMYHKYSFNPNVFYDNSTNTFPSGYVYQPHHPITIRTFSDYLEFGSTTEIDGIPGYAWYSQTSDIWLWRDLYSYGFIDSDGIGVDHPFINGSHYPFLNILFLQKPLKQEVNVNSTIIKTPNVDNCE